MADIFREVDEEVRRDKALDFWKKYQTHAIVAGALVIAAAGGWRFYQNSLKTAAEAAGDRYEAALSLAREPGKAAEADEAFRGIIAQGPAGYALLARFRSAANLAETDAAKAVGIYEALANDNAVDQPLRDIARLRAALLRMDDADYAEMRTRLEPLTQVGGPFRNTAREYLAIAALKANDLENAGRWLDAIVVDQQSPAQTRARAEALLGLVSAGKPKG